MGLISITGKRNQFAWLLTAAMLCLCLSPALAQQGARKAVQERQRENSREQRQAERRQQRPMQRPANPGLHGPGPHAGDWLRRYHNVPTDQQQRELEKDPAFRSLNPALQQNLRQTLQWFNSRPPEAQQRILRNMETWEHMTPEQQQTARHVFQHFRSLPEGRRHEVHDELNVLMRMSPADREKTLSSEAFRYRFSPEEQRTLREAVDLGIGAPLPPEDEAPSSPARPPELDEP